MKDFLFYLEVSLLGLQILLSLCTVIICIFRKSKVELKDTPFEKVIAALPGFIAKAERLSSDGSIKKSFVLSASYALLAQLTGEDVDVIAQSYSDRISEAIENILETPQKKEVIK